MCGTVSNGSAWYMGKLYHVCTMYRGEMGDSSYIGYGE